jgi:hypothetical protein
LKVSQACGTKLAVVRKAALKPMRSPDMVGSVLSVLLRGGPLH